MINTREMRLNALDFQAYKQQISLILNYWTKQDTVPVEAAMSAFPDSAFILSWCNDIDPLTVAGKIADKYLVGFVDEKLRYD